MIRTLLRLGRISNLPTVWTNALAAIVLVGVASPVEMPVIAMIGAGLALSCFYIGGMFLNDAFDAEYDRAKRADRPIPNGEISVEAVFAIGGGLVVAGIGIAVYFGGLSALVALALAVAVFLYDWLHKKVSYGPVIMGATRFLSYCLAAAIGARMIDPAVLVPALGLFAYIIGLTYAAKQEEYDRIGAAWPLAILAVPVLLCLAKALATPAAIPFALLFLGVVGHAIWRLFRRAPGDVPVAVITMIAGISFFDATMIAGAGYFGLGLLAAAGFLLTMALQKVAKGT